MAETGQDTCPVVVGNLARPRQNGFATSGGPSPATT
jgi:hypothetical protein